MKNLNKLRIDLMEQTIEALGESNRYLFGSFHGRPPINDEELIMWFIENGGAAKFRKKKEELKDE